MSVRAVTLKRRIGLVDAQARPNTMRFLGLYRTSRNQGYGALEALSFAWRYRAGRAARV